LPTDGRHCDTELGRDLGAGLAGVGECCRGCLADQRHGLLPVPQSAGRQPAILTGPFEEHVRAAG